MAGGRLLGWLFQEASQKVLEETLKVFLPDLVDQVTTRQKIGKLDGDEADTPETTPADIPGDPVYQTELNQLSGFVRNYVMENKEIARQSRQRATRRKLEQLLSQYGLRPELTFYQAFLLLLETDDLNQVVQPMNDTPLAAVQDFDNFLRRFDAILNAGPLSSRHRQLIAQMGAVLDWKHQQALKIVPPGQGTALHPVGVRLYLVHIVNPTASDVKHRSLSDIEFNVPVYLQDTLSDLEWHPDTDVRDLLKLVHDVTAGAIELVDRGVARFKPTTLYFRDKRHFLVNAGADQTADLTVLIEKKS